MLNESDSQNPDQHTSTFKVSNNSTYLGIQILPQLENIAPINYKAIVDSTFKSVERWMSLPISLIGRINIFKMSILPKFIYLFQNIPMTPPEEMFTKMSSLQTKFLWNKKSPRIGLSMLYLPFDTGGLKCPNLYWYYLAAQLRNLMFYFSTKNIPAWAEIESCSAQLPLHLHLYSAGLKNLKEVTATPIVLNMVNIWYEIKKHMGISDSLSQFSPIWGNTQFKPGKLDAGFHLWATKGHKKYLISIKKMF